MLKVALPWKRDVSKTNQTLYTRRSPTVSHVAMAGCALDWSGQAFSGWYRDCSHLSMIRGLSSVLTSKEVRENADAALIGQGVYLL